MPTSAPMCSPITTRVTVEEDALSGPVTTTFPATPAAGFPVAGSVRNSIRWRVPAYRAAVLAETPDFSICAFMSTRRASAVQGPAFPEKSFSPMPMSCAPGFVIPGPSIFMPA